MSTDDSPTVVRYPKGALPEPLAVVRRLGPGAEDPGRGEEPVLKDTPPPASAFDVVDVLLESRRPAGGARILLVGVGAMATQAYEAGRLLEQEGYAITVVHPHWVIPAPAPLVAAAAGADVVIVVEDGLVDGGIGSQLRDAVEEYQAAHSATGDSPVFRRIGVPRQFVDTATRAQLMEDFGMRTTDIVQAARRATDGVAGVRTDQDLRAE